MMAATIQTSASSGRARQVQVELDSNGPAITNAQNACAIESVTFQASHLTIATGQDWQCDNLCVPEQDLAGDVCINPVYTALPPVLANPSFVYNTTGNLSRIDYDGPHYKTFVYHLDGKLESLSYYDGFRTLRKNFLYNSNGKLTSVLEEYI